MSTMQDFGGWAGRVFDAKTLIALALIGCATRLATIKILDAAAWVSMCTTVGAFWGVGAVNLWQLIWEYRAMIDYSRRSSK